ncbi:uncharacterized protein [Antedon mediterranea]|uniref:uncharacterized protein n=1 Tax=Antedon mediterranea TaxID=105859 RepID=UPI003AF97B3D
MSENQTMRIVCGITVAALLVNLTSAQSMLSCSSEPCLNGGTCFQSSIRENYFCSCPAWVSGDNCEVNSPCSSDPCFNGGICLQSSTGSNYICNCLDEFSGDNCEVSVDLSCSSEPCLNGGTCLETSTGENYTCLCQDEFSG